MLALVAAVACALRGGAGGALAQEAWWPTCFQNGEELAWCCSRGDECFSGDGLLPGRSRTECCGAQAVAHVLGEIRAALIQATTHREFDGIAEALKAVLLSLDAEHLEAWEMLVQAYSRKALNQYDALVDSMSLEQVFLDCSDGPAEVYGLTAHSVARSLNYAAHLSERFFQVLWYNHARRIDAAPLDVDVELVRPAFAETLAVYKVLHQALDFLTYHPVGQNDLGMWVAAPASRAPTVVLVVVVVGRWADVAVPTLWSILMHRSVPLRVFVLGDDVGLADWRRMLSEAGARWRHALDAVTFEYLDIFVDSRMQAYLARLPSDCARTPMSVALFARLVCHELLPQDVHRAIAMDLGDILVFDDILELWREGDKLRPGELLAAASHRSAEEAWRRGKPSRLNGGVVLYELSRMRAANYTEDTLRAARLGLERRYQRFCVWDQDILNVMDEALWESRGVRVLPCRWSLFPVTGWQFAWNTPAHWLPELVELRTYPGLLSSRFVEHFCPDELQLLVNVFCFDTSFHKAVARDMALLEGLRNRRPGAATRAPDGSACGCGERAALLHVPSTMKLWPWAQRLFEHFLPPGVAKVPRGFSFASRAEQPQDQTGGGFWGAEDSGDLAASGHAALLLARDSGKVFSLGPCSTLPVGHFEYTRVEFKAPRTEEDLVVLAETNAPSDAHLFFGHIGAETVEAALGHPPGGKLSDMGLEVVLGAFGDSRSVVRWCAQGPELASFAGPVLGTAALWAKFWVRLTSSGRLTVGLGHVLGESPILAVVAALPEYWDWGRVEIYAGSLSDRRVQWLLCRS